MKYRALIGTLSGLALALAAQAQTVTTVIPGLFEPHSVVIGGQDVIYVSEGSKNQISRYQVNTGSLTPLAGNGEIGSSDGSGVLARFYQPQGMVAARGGLVVADSGNHTIRHVSFAGIVTTIAGEAGTSGSADGTGAAARFRSPIGLAVDSGGNIFVADSRNSAIRRIDPDNNVTTVASGIAGQPAAVVVGENGDLYVAATLRHVLWKIDAEGTATMIAGMDGVSGASDSPSALFAQFSFPRGLLWLGPATGLLITDGGNHTVRRYFFNSAVNDFSVETLAGSPGQSGNTDGAAGEARFNSPIGMARDTINNGFLVVDRAGGALRRIQLGPVQPPVSNPQIGYVEFVIDPTTGAEIAVLRTVVNSTFNNIIPLAIHAEPATVTYFEAGDTPLSHLEDTMPNPGTGSAEPPAFRNGMLRRDFDLLPPLVATLRPDLTIKAIGTQAGRRSSAIVSARFQFKTGNPSIEGDNAASFRLRNVTAGAEMYYTLDGSDPSDGNPARLGPISDGHQLSIAITEETTFKIQAFRLPFRPSDVVTKVFSPTDFVANRISFGFESGEASSDFVASPGQMFFAPVTLSILPSATMYSLQFNVTVTNLTGPSVAPGAIGFESMLQAVNRGEKLPPGQVQRFATIPPAMVTNIIIVMVNDQPVALPEFGDLRFTNSVNNLIGVGWLERWGSTHLYNTFEQDLIRYSIAKDNLFNAEQGRVVLGAYAFRVPPGADAGDEYRIQIGRPSATSDGVGAPGSDVFIEVVEDGSSSGGAINGTKVVTVGVRRYVVGDVAPFRWFNAGDFGTPDRPGILNDDVMQVFQSVAYGMHAPPADSDLFDAMDSCCGVVGSAPPPGDFVLESASSAHGSPEFLLSGSDTDINRVAFGDGQLDVSDVFVTFRRSLDPSLFWYQRYWHSSGSRAAEVVPNTFRGEPALQAASAGTAGVDEETASSASHGPAFVQFSAGDFVAVPGEMVNVPISVAVHGNHRLRVLMLNLTVQPLDGSPELTTAVQFTPDPSIGQPTMSSSRSLGNYVGAWLNSGGAGISGTQVIGTLSIPVPSAAAADSAYAIRFSHASASPNGIAPFPRRARHGLLTLSDRTDSSWNDGIPDSWRLRHFGSLVNILSHAAADADGDGVNNRQEFGAGTDPNDVASVLRLRTGNEAAGQVVLRWPSEADRHYVIESSTDLAGGDWRTLAQGVAGTGAEMEFHADCGAPGSRFYRIRVEAE